MDRRTGHRRFDKAAGAALLILLSGCAGDRGPPPPDPVASICSIPYPPVITRDEAMAIPPQFRRWASGTKNALQDNGCPVN